MTLFLSYAEEDGETAREIAEWFKRRNFKVFLWQDQDRRGGRFIERIEQEMREADGFLALLSPNFLASEWCRQERYLALQRELSLRAGDPGRVFIHVLKIAETNSTETGFLQIHDWIDITTAQKRKEELTALAGRLSPGGPAGKESPGTVGTIPDLPAFRNRHDELDTVVRPLTNLGGQHFWRIIAPPALGKSWFLYRLSDMVAAEAPGWTVRLVDVRQEPVDAHGDATRLLARLFDLPQQAAVTEGTLRGIAAKIVGGGKPYLCLLDSADLLNRKTARELRSYLSQIHHSVRSAGHDNVWLALVLASRREDPVWTGLAPSPRLSLLPLTEFKLDVVRKALTDLAAEMKRSFDASYFFRNAERIHRLSEGLPALLVRYLQRVRESQFIETEHLDSPEVFEELARPYIEQELLSQHSLFPWGGRPEVLRSRQDVLRRAFRILAPYRLFTTSHLNHHVTSDPDLGALLDGLRWTVQHLWEAIRETALVKPSQPETWEEIYPAIRRLLYRYAYAPHEQREAHDAAWRFYQEWWGDIPAGREQVAGLIERLWHEAVLLQREPPTEMAQALTRSVTTLFQDLKPTRTLTVAEVRRSAETQLSQDEEFQEAVAGVPGLFETLLDVIRQPEEPLHG